MVSEGWCGLAAKALGGRGEGCPMFLLFLRQSLLTPTCLPPNFPPPATTTHESERLWPYVPNSRCVIRLAEQPSPDGLAGADVSIYYDAFSAKGSKVS